MFIDNETQKEGKMLSTLSEDAQKIFKVLNIPLERATVLKPASCA
jgi:hypothetical protein